MQKSIKIEYLMPYNGFIILILPCEVPCVSRIPFFLWPNLFSLAVS